MSISPTPANRERWWEGHTQVSPEQPGLWPRARKEGVAAGREWDMERTQPPGSEPLHPPLPAVLQVGPRDPPHGGEDGREGGASEILSATLGGSLAATQGWRKQEAQPK